MRAARRGNAGGTRETTGSRIRLGKTSMEEMIAIRNLTKRFGAITAVDDVSFSVGRGEVLGFLGPNGAGKSTTMKMVAGFLAPSAGSAAVCGFDVQQQPIEAKS